MASWVGLLPQAPPPTQLENPVDIYTKAANLGDIQAQTRLRQQQAQENVVKLQQQQQAQQDANNFNAHYIQTRNSGGTMKDALDTAHTAGVSAPFIQKLSDADSQMRLRVAQADEANAKVTSQKADQVAGSFLPIKDIADEGQQAAAWAQARAASIAKGAIDPNDPYFPAQYPGVQGLNGAIAHALGAKEYSEYSTKTATEARAAREEAAKVAEQDAKTQSAELANAAQIAGPVVSQPGQTAGASQTTVGAQTTPQPSGADLENKARQKYPFLRNQVMVPSQKPGTSEGWPIGETGADDAPRPKGIPIDKAGLEYDTKGNEDDVAGEALHGDPFANKIRDKLAKTLTPAQITFLKKEALDYGDDSSGMSEEHRMQNAVDSAIRGKLVGQWPAEAVAGMNYTPEQQGILNQLQQYMKTGVAPDKESTPATAPQSGDETAYQNYLASLPKRPQAIIRSRFPNYVADDKGDVYDKIRRMGLTPQQQTEADEKTNKPPANTPVPDQAINTASQIVAKKLGIILDPRKSWQSQIPVERQPTVFSLAKQYQEDSGARDALEQNRADARADRSYQFNVKELDNAAKPTTETSQRIGDLKTLIEDGSPQAWANVPAKLLSLTVGGTGSGLRINNSLIDQELGGAGKWAELEGKLQQWSLDPKEATKIPDSQKAQIKSIVSALDSKIQAKQQIIDKANQDLLGSNNPMEHRKIIASTKKSLSDVDARSGTADQMINVQVPGHPPGKIHTSQKENFLRANPGATILP